MYRKKNIRIGKFSISDFSWISIFLCTKHNATTFEKCMYVCICLCECQIHFMAKLVDELTLRDSKNS